MRCDQWLQRVVVAVALAAGAEPLAAQRYTIEYTISMPDPSSHLYSVQMFIGGLTGRPVELQLPVWSPGRYARMDFARNVQEFTAVAANGQPLRWDKTNGSRWIVFPGDGRSMRVNYRVYANATVSGTFSVLNSRHANWNGPSIFMYVDGQKQYPVTLSVLPPTDSWEVINGEGTRPGQRFFHFPTYDQLVDTPTEVAPADALQLDSFVADNRLYRIMVHHDEPASDRLRQRFTRDIESIVRYLHTALGPPPIDQYTFLVHVGFEGRDGMEHLTSTQVATPETWRESATLLPGTEIAAHEYAHAWNGKRVRPATLGPFDYTREQYLPSLWVVEGWTQYYGEVALRRAGVESTEAFYRRMAALVQQNLTAPGRREVSARMSSFHAPFWDGAPHAQPANGDRVYFDYYTKGAGLAAYLDLFIRQRTNNGRSLNDAFALLRRASWDAPRASYYLQGRGYTEGDVERAVISAAGTDLRPWFDRHVAGTEDLDFDEALGWAGLRLVRGDAAWRIVELDDVTPEQRRIRLGWTTGRIDR